MRCAAGRLELRHHRREGLLDHPPGTNVANENPRVDDPFDRLLATSGRVRTCGPGESEPTCDSSALAANAAGAFLAGNIVTPPTTGNRIVYQFNQTGRYLVICMNRAHALNDHMFGFVNVVGGGDHDN